MSTAQDSSLSAFSLEKAVKEVASFNPREVAIRMRGRRPEGLRTGARDIGDVICHEPGFGGPYVHELVHHLQTTTTLSGVRLFHFRWETLINLFSNLPREQRQQLSDGCPLRTILPPSYHDVMVN